MKKFVFVVLACSVVMAYGQQTETRKVEPFTGVKTQEGVDVYLKKGDKESVRVEVTGTSPDNVITEVSGSYLKVHMKEGVGRFTRVDAKVYVTYVNVNKLSASSAGSIFSEGTLKANNMEISASSAGSIEVNVEAHSIESSASSAGDVELKGKTQSLSVDASSAGEIDAYDLEAENVEAEASSGASVKISVSKALSARASSGGDIRYRGNPDKQVTNSSSGGSVRKSN
ncbi:DUF2807 domain-containing protein [Fulvivirgaceae bacterium PWU4]|uniref:DUF2807 domain-containing protein n=1 Tax=Chryseosolibacter histidini TaxID=2782349 RepID=A0AAP2DHP5_9BACT|nr:head GIN domain-containing protein [Chryseosolibacter histidini]MBT1695794.1 DUF2807 domain-containing protein [Chryseosolibacter histidini]